MVATMNKEKRKYELLMGSHFEPTGKIDSQGNPEIKQYRMGDIVETETDLCLEFNEKNAKGVEVRGPQKFRDVTNSGPIKVKDTDQLPGETETEWIQRLKTALRIAEEAEAKVSGKKPNDEMLAGIEAMTVKELQAIAEDMEIDLKGESKKENIIKILRAKK